jgi:hypothetical protein
VCEAGVRGATDSEFDHSTAKPSHLFHTRTRTHACTLSALTAALGVSL